MPGELDLDDLARRATDAAQEWTPGCSISDVQPLTGGASSLTYTALVTTATGDPQTRIVLKVAPPGLEPVRNRDVARQARLMRALDGAPGVRVPTVYFEDDGDPPEVPPFHAMNIVPGECLEPLLQAPPPEVMPLVPDRAFAAARMLAALHRVDPVAVGLGEEKRTSLEAEIKRWTRAFETVDERMNARYLEAEELLFATMPPALPDAICHGDYRLGNMLCDGGDVSALIDWEIWSLSDPAPRPRVVPLLHSGGEAPDGEQPGADGHAGRGRAARRLRRGVRRDADRPRVVPLPHPVQGGGGDRAAHQAHVEGQRGRGRGQLADVDPRAHRRVHRAPAGLHSDGWHSDGWHSERGLTDRGLTPDP